jgi:hypothetical protein
MLRRHPAPTKKVTVLSAPFDSAQETLAVISEAIPEQVGCVRARSVGGTIVAEVPSILPSSIIERRLADAGIDAKVDTIVRFV